MVGYGDESGVPHTSRDALIALPLNSDISDRKNVVIAEQLFGSCTDTSPTAKGQKAVPKALARRVSIWLDGSDKQTIQ